ncbi:MAG: HDOD domain-containing protein [Thermodesulfovibrionales bacterium]
MMASAAEIKEFIRNSKEGSTIPAMLGRILSIVKDEASSSRELCELISYDQALAEMVLRCANSPMFGRSGTICDIEQAVMLLGYEQIKTIAVGMTVMKIFPAKGSFDIRNLWAHSCEVAFLAKAVGERAPMVPAREAFLAGLLHDIGRIIFYRKAPKRFYEIGTSGDMAEKEAELFGCTHQEAGAWYNEYAGIPEEIVAAIRYHHAPSQAPAYRALVGAVSLAEAMSRRLCPRVGDDGLWLEEHGEIMRELEIYEDDVMALGQRLGGMRHEIENFFG